MIKCCLFEFLGENESSKGILSRYLAKHPSARGAAKARLNDLRQHGVGTEESRSWCPHERDGIYKLKIKAKPQLRPHLCKGPFDMNREATILAIAIEEDFDLHPADVLERAATRREIVRNDENRRTKL